ncbi:type I-B CRISPR-associated protein Cas7/Csh2 [Acanthopleuribacter pedis]|uniref:Type I-B CRISPR-associated protein Cas7/Csh2 n=1 Tax=Acanthopleuribacter pedis TaxID=442870 RepID=A0A8J7Q5R9_9BACT|nr:type I-B CRISPR-associated protein Cas7/Csh2 [Acanthopleuribacter pedis]MBO1318511.1 type I-B CRISPR-associated protein Cas7/Csh2 [Acanthopleuribacter pedis]
MSLFDQREEFLFLYDVTMANPNGDPNDENKPRLDQGSGRNLVTDVRLKRTIRDHLFDAMGHHGGGDRDIFVRQTESKKTAGGLQDGKARTKDFDEDRDTILKRCIDIRLFGGVLPMDKNSFKFTGPVQIKMGQSLHRVEIMELRGTGAFASKDGAKQNTFREEAVVPYSLIAFYGVINENAARHTGLTRDDVDQFYTAMWDGTKNLLSRSKMGHMPRLLLRLRYKTPNFFLGDLDHLVQFDLNPGEKVLRRIDQGTLNLSGISAALARHNDHLADFELRADDRVKVTGWNR